MDVKQAVQTAKEHVAHLFADEPIMNVGLEEVEFHELSKVWAGTGPANARRSPSFPRKRESRDRWIVWEGVPGACERPSFPVVLAEARTTGNDGDGGGMPASFPDTPFPGCTDSRLLPASARTTGNDGLRETVCLSFVRHQASLPNERAGERAMEVRT